MEPAIVTGQSVAVHLDIGRIGDLDPTRRVRERVPLDQVVTDHGVIGDLMEDPGPVVVPHHIVLIQSVHVVSVGPQTMPVVVMNVIAADHQIHGLQELGPPRLPTHRILIQIVVESDLIVLDQNIRTATLDPDLTIVMDVVPPHHKPVTQHNPTTPVVTDLIIGNRPIGTTPTTDRPRLSRSHIVLDHKPAHSHIGSPAPERTLRLAVPIQNRPRLPNKHITTTRHNQLPQIHPRQQIERTPRRLRINHRLNIRTRLNHHRPHRSTNHSRRRSNRHRRRRRRNGGCRGCRRSRRRGGSRTCGGCGHGGRTSGRNGRCRGSRSRGVLFQKPETASGMSVPRPEFIGAA